MLRKNIKREIKNKAKFLVLNLDKSSDLTEKKINNLLFYFYKKGYIQNNDLYFKNKKEIVKDEFVIIRMLLEHYSQKEISKYLNLSTSTLEKRIRKLKDIKKVSTIRDLLSRYN